MYGVPGTPGRIHILVNNAGVKRRHGLVLRMEDGAWDEVIDTNLKGTFLFWGGRTGRCARGLDGSLTSAASRD